MCFLKKIRYLNKNALKIKEETDLKIFFFNSEKIGLENCDFTHMYFFF